MSARASQDVHAETKRGAIACQGGGSHTACTAGVLKTILKNKKYEIAALSGTSGGAICIFFAWYDLLVNDEDRAAEILDCFRQLELGEQKVKRVQDYCIENEALQHHLCGTTC
jgi:predicted acylesterase/phospholipase RssA